MTDVTNLSLLDRLRVMASTLRLVDQKLFQTTIGGPSPSICLQDAQTIDEAVRALSMSAMADGPVAVDATRVWMAQQLLDSRQTQAEAFEAIRNSPAFTPGADA